MYCIVFGVQNAACICTFLCFFTIVWKWPIWWYVLVSSTHLGPENRFLLLSDSCRFVDVGHPLWLEGGSVVYSCSWSLPVQSFLGLSPAGLMTIFCCLRFETPPTWRARSPYLYPPGTRWPRYIPKHVPFSLPSTTRRATVKVFKPTSMQSCLTCHNILDQIFFLYSLFYYFG
jgi:hypothetical protein